MGKITLDTSFEKEMGGYTPIIIKPVAFENKHFGGRLQIYATLNESNFLAFETETNDEDETLYSEAATAAGDEYGWSGYLTSIHINDDEEIEPQVLLTDFTADTWDSTSLSFEEEWQNLFEKDKDYLPELEKEIAEAFQKQIDDFKARTKLEWGVNPSEIRLA